MDLTALYSKVQQYLDHFRNDLRARKIRTIKEADFYFGERKEDAVWEKVRLPHDYAIRCGFDESRPTGGSGGYVISGIAWYRLYPGELDGHKRYTLCFDGTGGAADVWVNDRYMGPHPNGTVPFHYDITPYLQFDGSDVILVKCDTSLQPYSRFYGGLGLTREITLVENGRVHLMPGALNARMTKLDGKAEVEVYSEISFLRDELNARLDPFEGESNRSARFLVRTDIIDKDGNIAATNSLGECLVHCTATFKLTQKLTIENPILWSDEEPNLYRVHTQVFCGGKIVDDEIIPLGLRKLEKSPEKGLLVNGKATLLRGFCLHQDGGYYGEAVPMKEWVRRLSALREMDCNAIRTAHHPYPDLFYAVCDYMGFYVMDEAFDEWHRAWPRNYSDTKGGKNTYGYYLYFDQWARTDTKSAVIRNRRHPSVIMFSLGNEIPDYYYDDSVETYAELKAIVKKYAPDLWVTEGSEGQCNLPLNEDMLSLSDVVGLNYCEMRYHEKFYQPMHAKHPDWVMVGSENCDMGQHWREVEKQSYAIGMFFWTGIDYLGESGGSENPCVRADDFNGEKLCHASNSGKLDITLGKKAMFYYRKSLWAKEPMVYAAVKLREYDPWNFGSRMQARPLWNFEQGKKLTVYIMTNCEEAELILNGKKLGKYKNAPETAMPIEVDVDYIPGELKVIGYNKGKAVCENRIATYGEPKKLLIEPDCTKLSGAEDIVTLRFSLVDENGEVCQISDRKVTVEAENGELLAICSGNLADKQSWYGTNSYTLYRGTAQASFMSKDAGKMIIKASCEGAEDAMIEIEVE
ncbi:MAG: glycoside hydrolase family 2 protein [Clostridiales bacterium]|nr:glycoside hydrolase family 2 protein [Clostridiales bacterium]